MRRLLNQSVPKVATLSDESTLQSSRLTATNDVAFYVQSLAETDHDVFELTMASGRTLQISGGHPLIDGAGVVREARTFEAGDKLVRTDGTQDPIVNITYEAFHGRVYNVASVAPSLFGKVVVANGYLSGSARYQGSGQRAEALEPWPVAQLATGRRVAVVSRAVDRGGGDGAEGAPTGCCLGTKGSADRESAVDLVGVT